MEELKVGLEWGLPLPGLHGHETVVVTNALLVAVAVLVVFYLICRFAKLQPGIPQMLVEVVVDVGEKFLRDIGGPRVVKYLPFCLAIFIYILAANLIAMIPGFVPPTSNVSVNAGMAICVFILTFYVGIREMGFGKYFKHKMGPFAGLGWLALAVGGPIFLILESVGEFARPVSLSLRLFGNIFGEETFVTVLNNLIVNANELFPFLKLDGGHLQYFFAQLIMPLMYVLVTITSVLQAFIFAFLPILYFSAAVGWGEEEH